MSGSPTAKSLHSQEIPEIICQTSLSNLCIFHTFSKTQRKSEGKQVHSTWLNISLLPEWKMQTLVSIKNEDRAGWQPLPLYSHLSLTLEMFFGKWLSITGGVSCQAPSSALRAQTQGPPNSQNPEVLFKTEEEISQWAGEMQSIKMYPGLWKVPNGLDPPHATGICSFPLCCCSTRRDGGSKLRRVPSGTLIPYNAREHYFQQSTGEMAPVWNKQKGL